MATTIKKGDFVELDFVGRIKATGQIFDLTMEDVAKKEGLQSRATFEPMVACIGSGQLISGFDEQVTGKEPGKEFEFDLAPEKAFGRKNPKLIQLTSLNLLRKQDINPVVGMQLNIDNAMATVRSVSGGRVILDFNHPLSGKELHYWVKIRKIITDKKAQIDSLIKLLGVPCDVKIKDKTATLKLKQDVPKPIKDMFTKEIKKHVTGIDIKFA